MEVLALILYIVMHNYQIPWLYLWFICITISDNIGEEMLNPQA